VIGDQYCKPDIMYTEFVSATGLLHEVARVPLVEHLVFEQV